MTGSGLSATEWYVPSTVMTAARDRARGTAADRRDALLARDRFTLDTHDDRRGTPLRRTDRSGAGTGDAAKPSGTRDSDADTAAGDDVGVRRSGPVREATPGTATAGPRPDRAAVRDRTGDAGYLHAATLQAEVGAPAPAPAPAPAGAKDVAATVAKGTKAAGETSGSQASPGGADRGEAAAVPVVPVAPPPDAAPIASAPTLRSGTASDVGSAPALPAQAEPAAAGGATGSDAKDATTADGSLADASPGIADPREAATAVPAVAAVPAFVPAQAAPVPPAPTANGGGTALDPQAAAAKGGPVGSTDGRATEPARIDGDAGRDEAEAGAADGAGFEGVLAQATGDTPSVAVAPPDPTVAPARAEASAAARAAAPPPAPLPSTPPLPLGAVPMTIGLRSLKGSSQFEIRLDPVDLGRIDVTLDIDRDAGGASARLVVDRPETLALLRRDADSLQQALTQAGFAPGPGGISLSLRGEGSEGGNGEAGTQGRDGGRPSRGGTGDADAAAPLDGAVRALRRLGGLDIRI